MSDRAKDFAKRSVLVFSIALLTGSLASAQVKVTTWGSNSQLGHTAPLTNATPGPVANLAASGTLAIAADGSHSLAIKSNHTVLAWGFNSSGQLGDSTTISKLIPTPVVSLTNISAIAAGNAFSLALRLTDPTDPTDGTVWAWGSNTNGLGDGTSTQSNIPIQVKDLNGVALTGVRAIAAGNSHMLALKGDGTVWAWGANGNGQLGNGSINPTNLAIQVGSLTGIAAIAAAGSQSFALQSDGTVFAWGLDSNGQLGDGMPLPQQTTPVTIFGTGSGVMAIAAGSSHTLALMGDHTVLAWGSDFNGELGNGVASGQQPTPIPVAGLTDVMEIAAGNSFSLARKIDGSVMGWGLNGSGQVGQVANGTFVQQVTTPVQISGLTGIIKLAGGNSHSLALSSDGTVLAWGANTVGQLGRGTFDGSPLPIDALTGIDGNAVISAGIGGANGTHTLLRRSDGTVWAWGSNGNGQIGIGSITGVQMTPVQVTSLGNTVVAVAAGTTHSLALKNDGTVWVWGSNNNGQLGINNTQGSSSPVQVHGFNNSGFLTGIGAIAAGTNFSLALSSDGTTVWAWGWTNNGQLGDTTSTQRNTPVRVTFPAGTALSAIAAGASHGLALDSNSAVWAWGLNGSGQLGDESTALKRTPVQVHDPSTVGFLTGIATIAAGTSHSLAAKSSDGTLLVWGQNSSGQLGISLPPPQTQSSIPMPVSGMTSVSKIAGGGTHSLALKSDGSLWAWGNNNPNGQLGDGSLENRTTPVQTVVTGAQKIAAGNTHSVALTDPPAPVDTTPPVISNMITGTLGNNGWYRSDVTVAWTMTDPESGIASSTGCSTTTTSTETSGTTLTCTATNGAGLSSSQSVTIKIDKTVPSVSVTRTPANANGWNNGPVAVHFTITDTLSGVAGPTTIDQTVTTEGQNQSVSVTVMDLAGNSATATLDQINIDTTAPTVGFGAPTPAPNGAGWNRTDVTMNFTVADNLSGVATQSAVSPLSFTTEGTNLTGTVTVTDRAGNSATYTSPMVNIDKTGPTIQFGTPSPAANAAGWNKTDVGISFTVTDPLSGLGSTSTSSPLMLTTEGSNVNGTVTATDLAGNSTTATSPSVKIDKTGPTIQFGSPTPAANAAGWNKTDVGISFTVTDSLSGVGSTSPSSPLMLTTEGSNVDGTVTATDLAGNTTTATSPSVKIDKTGPTIQFGNPTPAANAAGWNKTDVGISFTVTDSLSGVDSTSPSSPLTLTTEGSNVNGTVTATDLAGNSTTATSPSVKIDKTGPTIQFGSPTPAANAAGWNKTDVGISFTVTDSLSGVGSTSPASPLMLTTEGSNVNGTVTATDLAGNTTTATSPSLKIDKTGPTIQFGSPTPAPNAAGWNRSDVGISFTTADNLSGIASTSPASPLMLTTDGPNVTGTVTVTDLAGNTTIATSPAVKIDRSGPIVSYTRTPAPNAAGWNNTAVLVRFTVSDASSGVDGTTLIDRNITTEGKNQSTTVTVTDIAGNTTTTTVDNINIDLTGPTVQFGVPSPAPNAAGWNNTDVSISYTTTDSLSGVASASPSSPLLYVTEGAYVKGTVTVTDAAGNATTATTQTLKIDKTPPVVTATAVPPPNAYGWNNTDVTVTFTGTDNRSGLAGCSPPVTLTTTGANQSASGNCTDVAGNVGVPATTGINIDKVLPTISGMPAPNCFIWPANKKLVQIAAVTGVDADSGINPNSFSIKVTSNEAVDPSDIVITGGIVQVRADRLGKDDRIYTVMAQIADRAGNSSVVATGSCTVPTKKPK